MNNPDVLRATPKGLGAGLLLYMPCVLVLLVVMVVLSPLALLDAS